MIELKQGDLLESPCNLIVHQVNCRGVMGSGIAKQIKDRFPETFRKYKQVCNISIFKPEALLGKNLYTAECNHGKNIIIASLFAQDNYGYGTQQTNYEALNMCLAKLAIAARELISRGKSVTIGIPYKLSCGRGGGDWTIVEPIIKQHLSEFNVTIYKLHKR